MLRLGQRRKATAASEDNDGLFDLCVPNNVRLSSLTPVNNENE